MMRAVSISLAIAFAAAPAAAAPKQKPAHPPAAIDVHNQRKVALTTFVLTTGGDEGQVVAKLAKPLAAGAKTRIKLSKSKGCEYLARWEFEDAGDEAQVNLCHDPKIILTD